MDLKYSGYSVSWEALPAVSQEHVIRAGFAATVLASTNGVHKRAKDLFERAQAGDAKAKETLEKHLLALDEPFADATAFADAMVTRAKWSRIEALASGTIGDHSKPATDKAWTRMFDKVAKEQLEAALVAKGYPKQSVADFKNLLADYKVKHRARIEAETSRRLEELQAVAADLFEEPVAAAA